MNLRAAAEQIRAWLADGQMSQWRYMESGDFYADLAEKIALLDAALAAEQPQPEAPSGWIACSERMPPESTRVLVAHTGLSLFVRPGTWQDGEWWKDGGMALVGVVTHWRPLPPAPEGAGEKR